MRINIVIPGLTRNLLLLGLLTLCACGQTLTREEPRELSLRAVAAAATKANPELTGTALPTDGTYEIHTSISAEGKTYASGQLFAYESADTKWHASPDPIYWPMSGTSVDFLALALKPAEYTALAPVWNSTNAAADVTMTDWDVYANQYDVLYATANNQSVSNSSTVQLNFQHALALICFEAKSGSTTGIYTIKGMSIKDLDYSGTLKIDNTKTEVATTWSSLSHDNKALNMTASTIAVPGSSDTELTDHLLVIPQASRTVTLTYRVTGMDAGAPDLTLTLPLPRVNWKAGHKYTYNLTFSATEITATVTVADWDGTAVETITVS